MDDRKIGAVGVKISQGVASHGIGINISTDLSYYKNIVPCGIEDCEVTTASNEVGKHVDIQEFGHQLVQEFYGRMKYDSVTSVSPSELFAPGDMALS